jgi:predicted nucleic acid-binding protein
MIVVDTNLIGYLLLASERSAQAEQVLQRDPQWAAPLLWRSELRNVLAVQVRAGRVNREHAMSVMAQAEELMRSREYLVTSQAVLRLAAESGCSAYDCEFVALAQDLDAPLVTVDRQVLAAFPNTAIAVERFCNRDPLVAR